MVSHSESSTLSDSIPTGSGLTTGVQTGGFKGFGTFPVNPGRETGMALGGMSGGLFGPKTAFATLSTALSSAGFRVVVVSTTAVESSLRTVVVTDTTPAAISVLRPLSIGSGSSNPGVRSTPATPPTGGAVGLAAGQSPPASANP